MVQPNSFDEAAQQRWEVIRQRKVRYVLTHGVLMWTLVGAVFYIIELDFNWGQFSWSGFGLRLLVAAVVGLVAGHFSYRRRERIYQRHKDKQ
ncbi:MAG: hypothetical protein WA958_11560 [Tunicatimonas sp.]